MADIVVRSPQTFDAAVSFVVVAVHIDKHLRRTAILCHVHCGHADQADARVRQLAFDQSFDLLAQGLAQTSPMVLDGTLLHPSPQGKTHENIRKWSGGLVPTCAIVARFGGSR